MEKDFLMILFGFFIVSDALGSLPLFFQKNCFFKKIHSVL